MVWPPQCTVHLCFALLLSLAVGTGSPKKKKKVVSNSQVQEDGFSLPIHSRLLLPECSAFVKCFILVSNS
uniref:Uncharacterized protein n=1 Tax=Mus musculus TaxID=10090 RepID=Q3UT42_MOUSE|nr:unnamed protein product [Mus musculus]